MLVTSKKGPERVVIPVRGKLRRRTETVPTVPKFRPRLRVGHRRPK